MSLFWNTVKLRGFLGKDAEVPELTHHDKVPYAVLTIVVDDGVCGRPANEWLAHGGWFRVIYPGVAFCESLKEMRQGDYVEIKARLVIHHYAEVNLGPAVGVIERYDG
jgi:hypothetical protein